MTKHSGKTVAVLHPGAMGGAVGAASVEGGNRTLWSPEGRSSASQARAEAGGLEGLPLPELLEQSDVVLSICPPSEAASVASLVADHGYEGTYVDANAVSPDSSRSIESLFDAAAVRFVDGGIVGLPPTESGSTRLYLSGDGASEVAELFAGTKLGAVAIDGGSGAASALKMCYASWTKGSGALLLAIRAVAEAEGVSSDLMGEWALSQPGMDARSEQTAAGFGPKAWRFAGEMEEIADTFSGADVPDGFFRSAAVLYERMASVKDQYDPAVTVDDLLRLILKK